MKPEAQRIAIAESCPNIKVCHCHWCGEVGHIPLMLDDAHEHTVEIPDYTADLNAMHEAEKTLSGAQWCEFCRQLGIIERCYEDISKAIHATADQRAEAFLKTLGKWTDE